jgi:phenylacetate-CoA ligase
MRRMAKITGRSDDMLIVRGVNLFPTQIEEQVLRCPGLAPHFLIEVTRPDRLDQLIVHVEARPGLSTEAQDEQRRLLAAHIKNGIGVAAAVRLAEPGTLERSAGKAVRVRDLRRQQG